MIFAFVNQKGGCGKSTTAVHFCLWSKRHGHSVRLVDADAQQSSSQWLTEMPDCGIKAEAITSADSLLEMVPTYTEDSVVIDSPAGIAEETRAILYLANVAIVPIQASGLDLQSSAGTFRRIRQIQALRDGQPIARSFLSRSSKGTRLEAEAIEALGSVPDIPRLSTVVRQRTAIAEASVQRCGVHDRHPRDPIAEREVENLCAEINSLRR